MNAKAPIPIMAFKWECWKNFSPPRLYVYVRGTSLTTSWSVKSPDDLPRICQEAHDKLQKHAARLLRTFRKWEQEERA